MPTTRKETRRTWKREAVEWALLAAVFLGLYVTGTHTAVLGGMQRALLWTGLFDPGRALPAEQQVPARYDVTLTTLDGAPLDLAELRGQTIFLNFWATWCPPCLAELPGIQTLHDRTDPDEVAFVLVALDDEVETVRSFVEAREITAPVYRLTGPLPSVYDARTIPTTYVIDPNGRIVLKEEGLARYDEPSFARWLRGL